MTGPVAIQFPNGCYMKAMDNGKFVLGAPHGEGEGPDPEEVRLHLHSHLSLRLHLHLDLHLNHLHLHLQILMAMRVGGEGGGGKISLKSGYDRSVQDFLNAVKQICFRFVRLNKHEQMHGASEAVGRMEEFEPVWQAGACALLGPNNKFLTADEDDLLVCTELAVGEGEVVRIRSNKEKEDLNKKVIPVEERGSAADVELKFTKKFMKFQDHKYKVRLDAATQGQIYVAKEQGNLHEHLLDRREKMKSDRMCK